MRWRHTQVVKGEVCKTSIPRFESGWRLHFKWPGFQRHLLGPGLLLLGLGCQNQPDLGALYSQHLERSRPVAEPPSDTPPWSETKHVHWAPLTSSGTRVLVIDEGGGRVDALLDNLAISRKLNLTFRAMFLHPRARPSLTQRFNWPSVTVIDAEGCLLVTGQPTTKEAVLNLLEAGEAASAARQAKPLPPPILDTPPADGGGRWTKDNPKTAGIFVTPERGAPAVVWENRPYIYGNRSDAELLRDRPAARNYLDRIGDDALYAPQEGPLIRCPLGTEQP